jgi:hypothetical protein
VAPPREQASAFADRWDVHPGTCNVGRGVGGGREKGRRGEEGGKWGGAGCRGAAALGRDEDVVVVVVAAAAHATTNTCRKLLPSESPGTDITSGVVVVPAYGQPPE